MKRKSEQLPLVPKCDQWRGGLCLNAPNGEPMYCPLARAAYASTDCCHHPLYRTRQQLLDLRRHGVKIDRYKGKLTPELVDRLHRALQKKLNR